MNAWTEAQENLIKAYMANGMNRSNAVRKMRACPESRLAEAVVEAAKTPDEFDKAVAVAKTINAAKARVPVKAAKAKRVKPTKTVKLKTDLPVKSSEKVKNVDRSTLDDIIRKSLRSAYGKVCPILGVLGQRFTVPSQKSGYPFYRVLVDTPDGLKSMFISGFYDGQEAKHSISDVDPKSYTVSRLLKSIAKRTKREAEKLAKGKAKKAAK